MVALGREENCVDVDWKIGLAFVERAGQPAVRIFETNGRVSLIFRISGNAMNAANVEFSAQDLDAGLIAINVIPVQT